MSKIRVDISGDTASVYTPYNTDFVSAVRRIGGSRWDRSRKCWEFPAQAIDAVRLIMKEVYGETDIETAEKVSVRVTFTDELCGDRKPVTLFGKTIASAFGRDSGAKVGEDVAFINKMPRSGGSVKNWLTVVPKGAVAEIRDVVLANVKAGPEYTVEFIKKDAPDIDALRKEKEMLLLRLNEINLILGIDEKRDSSIVTGTGNE